MARSPHHLVNIEVVHSGVHLNVVLQVRFRRRGTTVPCTHKVRHRLGLEFPLPMIHRRPIRDVQLFIRPEMPQKQMCQFVSDRGELHRRLVVAIDVHAVLRRFLLVARARLITRIAPAF